MCGIIKNISVMFLLFFSMGQINSVDQVFEDFPLIRTKNGVLHKENEQKRFDLWRSADRKSVVLKETCLHSDGEFTVKELPLLTLKQGNIVGVAASTKTFSSRYRDTIEVVISLDGKRKTLKARVDNILDVFDGKEQVKWFGDWLFDEFVIDKEPKNKTIKEVDVLWRIQEYKEEVPSLFGGYTAQAIDDKAPQKSTKASKLFLLFCCILSAMVLQQGSSV